MSDDIYDRLIANARRGCCDERRKPCEYHNAYGDGLEAMQQASEPALDVALYAVTLMAKGDAPRMLAIAAKRLGVSAPF